VELSETLKFHVGLAAAANAPSEFRILNGYPPYRIGTGNRIEDDSSQTKLFSALGDSPMGNTPLCEHIRQVIAEITRFEPELRARGQKAAVIIATDGESSDGDMAQAMQPLQHLPVWVVIRLCTDDKNVVRYWNQIDE
jgi:hypothetical protein